ncbi:MAG: hypothetical protein IKT24_05485 [Clostridia bacterium]|nr:hypothetical protein [Clostridia bacterium]
MSRTTRLKISIALKFAVFLCVAAALFFDPSADLKFFTNQSNLLIGALDLVFAFMLIGRIKDGSLELTTPHYIMQLIATVAITLTGIIFCFVLLPVFLAAGVPASMILSWRQILLHIVVPVLAVVDFLCFTRPLKYSYMFRDCLFPVILPLYYLIFEIVCYRMNLEFAPGINYPYFFMNWASPAGLFGFSNQMPYFMGNGYWMILILLMTFGISFLYLHIVNKGIVKNRDNLI